MRVPDPLHVTVIRSPFETETSLDSGTSCALLLTIKVSWSLAARKSSEIEVLSLLHIRNLKSCASSALYVHSYTKHFILLTLVENEI